MTEQQPIITETSPVQILFPGNYFPPKEPDEMLLDQATAFQNKGLSYATINLENWSVFGVLQSKIRTLYRGWMLNAQDYIKLIQVITGVGAIPFTSLDAYLLAHHLPNWYPILKDLTPETVIFSLDDNLENELKNLDWKRFFIKDYVKSLKTEIGSIIEDNTQIHALIEQMQKFRGNIEGGICVRRVEDFMPETEKRYFIVNGIPYSAIATEPIPDIVKECADRIKSPFFSVDTIVRRNDSALRVVEIGDGQVSDIVGWKPARLAEIFSSSFLGK